MRSMQRNDSHKPATPDTKHPRSTNLQRRGFLLTLGVGGAGAAAMAVRSISGRAIGPAAARDADGDAGYQMTEHVRRYYQTAKL
jgi:hypothetical protein